MTTFNVAVLPIRLSTWDIDGLQLFDFRARTLEVQDEGKAIMLDGKGASQLEVREEALLTAVQD